MSKETFYFSHDYNARNDMKIKKLIIMHGYEGYGLFWALIEDLYQNENALPLDYECIAYDLRTSSDIIESIVNDFDLFVVDDETFGSLSVQRRLLKRIEISEKRANAGRISAKKRKKAASAQQNSTSVQQIPTKESKVKESKVKDIGDTNVSLSDAEHPTQEKIDYKAVINFFNEETQGVFGYLKYPIGKSRKESIRARITEFGKDGFAEMVRKATKSDFLKGDGNKGFVAKFDWMIRPSNFQKILEGNYDNKNKGFSGGDAASDAELMHHIRQGIARGIQENEV